MTTTLERREEEEREERERLGKRAEDLTQQNKLLHEEAEKLSARILTLQEQHRTETTPTLTVSMATGSAEMLESSSEQLWEIIR